MSEWQPISTAPKDGSSILACVDYRGLMVVVHWRMNEEAGEYGWHHEDGHNDPWWYRSGCYLTHWQPLPESPK